MTQFSMKRIVPCMLALATAGLTACQTTQGNYADPDKVEIVDDRWNETDARLTGEQMIRSALAKPWLKEFTRETQGKRPFVLVDDFENRTSEQIDTKALFESVRNELMNSQKVRFLDGAQRQKILDEYKYQQSGVVKQGAAKGPGKQHSADFFMVGAISSQVAEADGYKTVTYQVEMRLTNIETSEIAWTEIKKLKKQFRRSRFGL
ncbi:MAG: penicillin-binding protein activator LpoB [Silvanigrellaceae bacterium]